MRGCLLATGAVALALACMDNRTHSVDSAALEPAAVMPSRPASMLPVRWPSDPMKRQLGNLSALDAPIGSCGESATIAGESVGPLHIGQSLASVAHSCPQAVAFWDLGDEGIPAPVLVVRFGAARFELAFDDTLAGSALSTISARDTAARTPEGIHPGSSFTDLIDAYGKPTLEEGECVLNVSFAAHPGLAFRLDTQKQITCEAIPDIATRNAVERLPTNTRVEEVLIYHPPPAT